MISIRLAATLAAMGAAILSLGEPAEASSAAEKLEVVPTEAAFDVSDEDHKDCGPGKCDNGSFCDGCQCYAPDAPISLLMCQCKLLDPGCGVGTCEHGAYLTGTHCPAPVGFPPSTTVAQVMCAGAALDPKTCEFKDCTPSPTDQPVGVCDKFSGANGPETSSPSPDLLAYIASVYAYPGTRDLDEIQEDAWFGHTFSGLAPQNGKYICGARLTGTIGKGVGGLADNDTLGLMFVDPAGDLVGPSHFASLASHGISGGSAASISIDIGGLPGGAAMLAQMQNGWLDFIVQDDTAVDCLDLQVDYCCPCKPYATIDAAGVPDDFAPDSEHVSPSAGLLAYIDSVYSIPGSRDFDDVTEDRWLGHTFSGLAPKNGAYICGATLTTRIGMGVGGLAENDSLGLMFVDAAGHVVAPGYNASLTSFGISGGSSETLSLSIGSLPGGAAMLAQMQNGWLDFIVQDDTAVDYVTLTVDYCCKDNGCGAGQCIDGSFCDDCQCYAPDAPISLLMCQCQLLDPGCGVGFCEGGAYMTGASCPAPVGYPPSSVISQVMCGGFPLDPKTCDIQGCVPSQENQPVGVCDDFSPLNGAETPSPSPGLLSYIGSVYAYPGTRDLDKIHKDAWFGHTFSGLAPGNGKYVCGARLTGTIGRGVGGLADNDSLGLMFVDAAGNLVGPSYFASLSSFGISGGSTASIFVDIGGLPGGAAMLAQMQNGWIDFIVQDDTAVDCLNLEVDFCCPCKPYSTSTMAGFPDGIGSDPDPVSPSAGLLAYIASVYSIPGSRDFDEVLENQWLGHTFTGLAPLDGTHICGATLTALVGEGVGGLADNDAVDLMFVDPSGHLVGPIYGASLASFGISGGSSGIVTLDIGTLPGGAGILAQMEAGWLDFVVQDDTAVDHVTLDVDYCCKDIDAPLTFDNSK